MPPEPPKRHCVKRKLFLAGSVGLPLLGTVPVLGAVSQGTATAPKSQDESHGAVRAGQDVILKSVRLFMNQDDNADGLAEWLIVSFNWTNNLGYAIAPKVTHWTIMDVENMAWSGTTSGSSILIGMPTYYDGQLQRGESHDYTVGFHVTQRMVGTLYYDATY